MVGSQNSRGRGEGTKLAPLTDFDTVRKWKGVW